MGLNGLPEAAEISNFVKAFFSIEESVRSPQSMPGVPQSMALGPHRILEGAGDSWRSQLGPRYLDLLLKKTTGLGLGS